MSNEIGKKPDKLRLSSLHAGILPRVSHDNKGTLITFNSKLMLEPIVHGQTSTGSVIEPITLKNLVFLFCDPPKIKKKQLEIAEFQKGLPKKSEGYPSGKYDQIEVVKQYQEMLEQYDALLLSYTRNGGNQVLDFISMLDLLDLPLANEKLKKGIYYLRHHQTNLKRIPNNERLPNVIELVMLTMALLADKTIPENSTFWFPSNTKVSNKLEERYCVEASRKNGVRIVRTELYDDRKTPKTFVHNILTLSK